MGWALAHTARGSLLFPSGCSGGAVGQQPQASLRLSPHPSLGPLPHLLHQEDGSRVPLAGMGAPGHRGRAPRLTGGLETSLKWEGIRACSSRREAESPDVDQALAGLHPPGVSSPLRWLAR